MSLFKPSKKEDTASRFAKGGSSTTEQSGIPIFYECPKCYGGPLVRNTDLIWKCYRCGVSWDMDKRGRIRVLSVDEGCFHDDTATDILAEKLRRDMSEKLIALRKHFDTFRDREADVPYPKLPADRKSESITIHGRDLPLVVGASEIRVPDRCPVCSGNDLVRDERFVWHCPCGAKFYYTDHRAEPYTANSYHELELLCGYYAKNESLLREGKEPDASLPNSEIDALKQFLNI